MNILPSCFSCSIQPRDCVSVNVTRRSSRYISQSSKATLVGGAESPAQPSCSLRLPCSEGLRAPPCATAEWEVLTPGAWEVWPRALQAGADSLRSLLSRQCRCCYLCDRAGPTSRGAQVQRAGSGPAVGTVGQPAAGAAFLTPVPGRGQWSRGEGLLVFHNSHACWTPSLPQRLSDFLYSTSHSTSPDQFLLQPGQLLAKCPL